MKKLFFAFVLSLAILLIPTSEYASQNIRLNVFASPQASSGHSVTLNWIAPVIPAGNSCVVSSYNVKRSATTGTEVTIASSATTTYVDTAVTSGQKYFYVVTAVSTVSTCNGESGPSNEAVAQIPLDQLPAPTSLAAGSVR